MSKFLARWKLIAGIVVACITGYITAHNFIRPSLVFAGDLKAEIDPIKRKQMQLTERSINIERILTLNEIRTISQDIADLEYKQRREPEEWTRSDARQLAGLKSDLEDLRDDLDRLRKESA